MTTNDGKFEHSSLESYDRDGYTDVGPTSVLPGGSGGDGGGFGGFGTTDDDAQDTYERRPPLGWHGGADFGLFVLRLALGAILGAHGMQVLFGSFGGMGIGRFTQLVGDNHYTHASVIAHVAGWSALVCGVLIVLGALTSLAASVALALLANVVYLLWGNGVFHTGNPVEYPIALAAMTFCVMMSGPGRWALELGRGWHRRAAATGWVCLLVAIALTVVTLLLYHVH